MRLLGEDRLPWGRGEVVGFKFEMDLGLGDVGVSDDLGC